MKLTYTNPKGNLTFEQDGVDRKAAFELVAVLDELFGEEKCGCCGSEDIRHQVTHPGEYTYYKLKCQNPDCGAVLDFGQNKDMKGLFVKRWDADERQPLPNNGWYVWDGQRRDGGGQDDRRRDSYGGGQSGGRQQTTHPRQGPQQGQGRPQQQHSQNDDDNVPF